MSKIVWEDPVKSADERMNLIMPSLDDHTVCKMIDKTIEILADESENLSEEDRAKQVYLNLLDIKAMAQRMENGLAKRKTVMINSGVEEFYQKSKKEETASGEEIPYQVHQLDTKDEKPPEMSVEVKIKGKRVYTNRAYAMMVVTVDRLDGFDGKTGSIIGRTGVYTVGHPIAVLFAFDQLKQKSMQALMTGAKALQNLYETTKGDESEINKKFLALAKMWDRRKVGQK